MMNDLHFWDDKRGSEKVISELNDLKSVVERVSVLRTQISNNLELLEQSSLELDDDFLSLITEEKDLIEKNLEELEISILLNGPYDALGSIVEIHSGAGGTEACDWALMLERMYMRWCDKHHYQVEVLDRQDGEEAGIKGVSFMVRGYNSYGYLKSEKGVHRLIRISPFDSNSRRHTSFASVDVTPLFQDDAIDLEIRDSDLRIDVYRSSGCGGQGVNTTDSAVRITHLPTKIVVTCQNERSQIQNKEKAMEVLKNKLYQLEIEKRDAEMRAFKGDVMDINFGSQIRTYTMHPYSLVKDHRTNSENTNVLKVLDGDIDQFQNDYLKRSV